MEPITTTDTLAAFCARQSQAPFITVDTEFLRDDTYWPQLCLVQVGGPSEEAAIDTLAPGLDLAPLLDLLRARSVLKVFHAARNDLEIFYQLMDGALPEPVFDTQMAAMVCGFGDQVGYNTLVQSVTGTKIEKTERFTDWSRRPLSAQQIEYALADVTYLRDIYAMLRDRLAENGRASWLDEEMAALTDPSTYAMDPETAAQRVKPRSNDRKYLTLLRAVAIWREREAQRRDMPRNRLLRDEQIHDIAAQAPRNTAQLARTRGVSEGTARGAVGQSILAAVEEALAVPANERPRRGPRPDQLPKRLAPMVELLKVLLKTKSEAHGVAQKLIASGGDLERIVGEDQPDVPALRGWRYEIFGKDALALKRGDLALAAGQKGVRLISLAQDAGTPAQTPPNA